MTKYVCWTDDDLWMTATVEAHAPDEAALEYIEELVDAGRATGGETIHVIPLTPDHAYDYEYDDLVTSFDGDDGDDGDDLDWGDDTDDDAGFEIDFDEFFADDEDVDDNEYEGPVSEQRTGLAVDAVRLDLAEVSTDELLTAAVDVLADLVDRVRALEDIAISDVEPPRRSLWRTFFG